MTFKFVRFKVFFTSLQQTLTIIVKKNIFYGIDNKLEHEVTYATKTKCLTYVIKNQNMLIPQPPKDSKFMFFNYLFYFTKNNLIVYFFLV